MRYHTTVRSALREVARLARASPYVVIIQVPISKAADVAVKQSQRYPTITADHSTRSALRRIGFPVVQMVILPPDERSITLLLLTNSPPDDREKWQLALDPDWPLRWRNYQLCRMPSGAISWKLSEQANGHYRQRINRLITGRGGIPEAEKRPYQLSPATAYVQIMKLAEHLSRYPGFAGVRGDVFALAMHSTKVWQNTHPDYPFPRWPTMPYVRFGRPQTAPLSDLLEVKNAEENE
ncbi:hypothetical protein [Deinococcus xinjiangensis]|uniref:hypothetical protein n=1 Tax=Deinococcus xinjiangensis TaxID=457454 RepID=UPI0033656261